MRYRPGAHHANDVTTQDARHGKQPPAAARLRRIAERASNHVRMLDLNGGQRDLHLGLRPPRHAWPPRAPPIYTRECRAPDDRRSQAPGAGSRRPRGGRAGQRHPRPPLTLSIATIDKSTCWPSPRPAFMPGGRARPKSTRNTALRSTLRATMEESDGRSSSALPSSSHLPQLALQPARKLRRSCKPWCAPSPTSCKRR